MKKRLAPQNYLPEAYKMMKELDGIIKSDIEPLYLEISINAWHRIGVGLKMHPVKY